MPPPSTSPTHPSAPIGDAVRSRTLRPLDSLLENAADVAGPAFFVLVVGAGLAMQIARVNNPALHWLILLAVLAAAVILFAYSSGRLSARTMLLGLLLAAWPASASCSTYVLRGEVEVRWLAIGLVTLGLFLGIAATNPSVAGWCILGLGALYIYANLFALYRGYFSLGNSFWATSWYDAKFNRTNALGSLADYWGAANGEPLPYPEQPWSRAVALLFQVPRLTWFSFGGLAINSNHTGNYIAPIIPFVVPFAAGRWLATGARHPIRVRVARASLAISVVAPGFFLLYVLEARTALLAALLGIAAVVIPLSWTRRPLASVVTLASTLVLVMTPFFLTSLLEFSWNGRDCVWNAWLPIVHHSPLWGAGAPGTFVGYCPELGTDQTYPHAHNEILQAWNMGGLLGLAACVGALAVIAWDAPKLRVSDNGALLSVLVCVSLLMGMEVLATSQDSNWPYISIVWVIAIAARSIRATTSVTREGSAAHRDA